MARVVVISGGGTGIGRETARLFAADGEQVVLVGRRAEVLRKAAGELDAEAAGAAPSVATVAADLAVVGDVERLRDEVAERFGHLDVLVNNAGGNPEIGASEEDLKGLTGTLWHWEANFRVNVLTAVLPTEALRDLLTENGRVVMLSSIAAFRGSGTGSYAAAKAALHPYAVDLAQQLGPRGITVNTVAPGGTGGTEFFGPDPDPGIHQARIARTDLGRLGTPAEVAHTVHWLASPHAGYITGEVVHVNGGAVKSR